MDGPWRGQIYAKSVSNRPSIITAVYSLQQYTAAYTAVNSSIQQHTTLYNSIAVYNGIQRFTAVYIRQYTAVHNTIHSIQQYTVYSRIQQYIQQFTPVYSSIQQYTTVAVYNSIQQYTAIYADVHFRSKKKFPPNRGNLLPSLRILFRTDSLRTAKD